MVKPDFEQSGDIRIAFRSFTTGVEDLRSVVPMLPCAGGGHFVACIPGFAPGRPMVGAKISHRSLFTHSLLFLSITNRDREIRHVKSLAIRRFSLNWGLTGFWGIEDLDQGRQPRSAIFFDVSSKLYKNAAWATPFL
jgi:hypothetical protein